MPYRHCFAWVGAVLIAGSMFFSVARAESDSDNRVVILPTCTQEGYTIVTDPESGVENWIDAVPALGHSYGEWKRDGDEVLRQCALCGNQECRAVVEPARIELYGSMEGIGKKDIVLV